AADMKKERTGGHRGMKAKPKSAPMKEPMQETEAEENRRQEMTKKVAQLRAGKATLLNGLALSSNSYAQQSLQQNLNQQFDPNNVVQTGPGVPRWGWNKTVLHFSGPVQRDQQLKLWLLQPSLNLLFSLLRVALLVLLLLRLLDLGGLSRKPPLSA